MGTIIDLASQPDHEVLHSTGSDGLLGGEYLHGEPLASFLEADERPKYVVRNKKSGLTVEGPAERTLAPDSGYQGFALVTDLRIVFVAGKSGGDESMSLPLSEVVEASVDSGFRTSTLAIETLSNERWVFPCRGDPSPVAAHIEESAQIWANASRLLDDARDTLTTAEDHVSADEYAEADALLEDAAATLETARNRISEVGEAASSRIGDRAGDLRESLDDIRRELAAGRGGRAHARGQESWENEEYEAAARAYERALAAYESALATDGSSPTDAALRSRYEAAAAEREVLRVGPLVDADASRRRAVALADPEDAAAEWEVALERYRELLGLDWGAAEREFAVDHDLIREQTTEIADDAIDDHHEAGVRWLRSGDKLAVQEREAQAMQVYDRARHQFEQANRLAGEVRPGREAETKAALDAVESRLDGAVPTAEVPEDPLAFDPSAESEREASRTESEGLSELSFHDTGKATEPAGSVDDSGVVAPSGGPDGSPSVLERIQAQKEAVGAGPFETGADAAPEAERAGPATEDDGEGVERTGGPEGAGDGGPGKGEDPDEGDLGAELDRLSTEGFAEFVAELWEADGWMTTVFEASGETVYDVVAVREGSDDRLLIWTHCGEGADRTTIKQCAATLEDGRGAAVLVTTGSLTAGARRQADELGVGVVERGELIDRIEAAGLTGRVREYTESPHA